MAIHKTKHFTNTANNTMEFQISEKVAQCFCWHGSNNTGYSICEMFCFDLQGLRIILTESMNFLPD